jgi:hypothetical protein
MRHFDFIRSSVVALALVSLLCYSAGVALAQEGDDAPDPQPGDIIFVEGFEGFENANDRVMDGWQTWYFGNGPEYKQANPEVAPFHRPYPDRVHSGNNAQQYFSVFRVHDAGLYRRIEVPPYAVVEVTAWGSAWTSGEDDPKHSDAAQMMNMRVGVASEGGSDPNAATWGDTFSPLDTWQPAPAVRVTAGESGIIAVFLRSSPYYPVKHNDVYWDDVTVMLVEPGQAPAPSIAPASGASPGGGGIRLAAPPQDPILSGLTAEQMTAQSGGVETWLPAVTVLVSLVAGLWVRRKMIGRKA